MNEKKIKCISTRTYIFINGKWVNEKSNIELDPHDPDYRIIWDIKPIS